MASPPKGEKEQSQDDPNLQGIARISMQIRHAIRKALPAPPEQFFTVMVPAKVINFADYDPGFDNDGKLLTPLLPMATQLNEAILCDDMPALSAVQLGPTGRSVARSYSTTLNKLVPAVSTFEIDESQYSAAEKRYKQAMDWFVTEDPAGSGRKRVDVYVEKQKAYTDAVERKTKAFDDALAAAMSDTTLKTSSQKRAAYDQWVSENGRAYNTHVDAAYTDWVVVGKKKEAEYWFAIVDNDSAMSRVEASKESMRAATVSDTDGAAEYNKVQLTPSNWAWIAKRKAQDTPNPFVDDDGRTVEWYKSELNRLYKMNWMLEALYIRADDPRLQRADDSHGGDKSDSAAANYAAAVFLDEYWALAKEAKETGDTTTKKEELDAWNDLGAKREDLAKVFATRDRAHISALLVEVQEKQKKLILKMNIAGKMEENKKMIEVYDAAREKLVTRRPEVLQDAMGGASFQNLVNYWTPVSVDVAYPPTPSQTTNYYSEGNSASWGMWSAGGYLAQSGAGAKAVKQMASSSVKVSFDCMRVDISRPWIRPELFRDSDLKASHGISISPGPLTLGWLMDPNSYEIPRNPHTNSPYTKDDRLNLLSQDNLFPMYPTAFLLAANVVLEIKGATEDIRSHFDTSSTNSSLNIGYGPFTINTGRSSSDADSSRFATYEATESGCRIMIKSPQIIGWISEMVPALPRLKPLTS